MIEVGSKVTLNDKYMDNRKFVGKVMTVTNVGPIGGTDCVWVDEPGFGGCYAADGFDGVEGGDAS